MAEILKKNSVGPLLGDKTSGRGLRNALQAKKSFHGAPSPRQEEAAVKTGIIQVGEDEFHWRIHRQPTWVTSGTPYLLGLAIAVNPTQPGTRELILEFDIEDKHRNMRQHQRFRLSDKRLRECIENAKAAGWDPHSRGKSFTFSAGSVS